MIFFITTGIFAGGCDWCTKCGQEELPHVRGQGQKPGGPHARGAAAKRSYPTTEVRGSGRECQAATAQERPGGATPGPRIGGCAGAGGPRGAIPRSRLGGAVVRRYRSSKVRSSGYKHKYFPRHDILYCQQPGWSTHCFLKVLVSCVFCSKHQLLFSTKTLLCLVAICFF